MFTLYEARMHTILQDGQRFDMVRKVAAQSKRDAVITLVRNEPRMYVDMELDSIEGDEQVYVNTAEQGGW